MTSTDNTSKRIEDLLDAHAKYYIEQTMKFFQSTGESPALSKNNEGDLQAKSLIMELVNEARIEEINLFREAMINHSTPMIYAPKRIEQLKSGEL